MKITVVSPSTKARRFCLVFAVAFVGLSAARSGEARNTFFGSKTPYDMPKTDWDSLIKDAQLPNTCKLVHIRFVARHGTRSLGEEKVEDAEKAVLTITKAVSSRMRKGSLTEEQVRSLLGWKNQLPVAKELLERGRNEHTFLADDLYNLVAKSPLARSAAAFRFESSNVSRARESALAFQTQWNSRVSATVTEPVSNQGTAISVDDQRLYYHKNCQAYVTRVAKNNAAKAETKRAKTTREGAAVVERINREKFAFSDNFLSWKDIFALYEMAAFETAALNSSALSVIFDDEDLAFLEYADDLEQYWQKSYSRDAITRRMSCVLTSDIFATAASAYQQSRLGNFDAVESVLSFAHLETLLPVYAAFDLFHDAEDGYVANATRFFYANRRFDTSEMGKMASNFAFLFFDCPESEAPRDKMVLMVVNGRLQSLPGACPYELACPFEKIREAYPLATGNGVECDLSRMCSLDSNDATSVGATFAKTHFILLILLLNLIAFLFGCFC